jgi:hypothetical protein
MEIGASLSDKRLTPGDLFQVLIRDKNVEYAPLSETPTRNAQSLKETYPLAKYHLLNDSDVRAFLAANFGADVREAYDVLLPYAYKSDLARFCLLFAHGGLYADIGLRFVNPFTLPAGCTLGAFRDAYGSSKKFPGVCVGLILAAPRQPELKIAMELVVENCRNRYYGAGPLDPTGPHLFGRALALSNHIENYYLGDYRAVSPDLPRKNHVCISPDGVLVALGKDAAGGDLETIGLSGTTNYNDFWRMRQVYRSPSSSWEANHPAIRSGVAQKTDSGIVFGLGLRGIAVAGPGVPLTPGQFRAEIAFSADTVLDDAQWNVVAKKRSEMIKNVRASEVGLSPNCEVVFDFDIASSKSDVEIIMIVNGTSHGRFRKVTLVSSS